MLGISATLFAGGTTRFPQLGPSHPHDLLKYYTGVTIELFYVSLNNQECYQVMLFQECALCDYKLYYHCKITLALSLLQLPSAKGRRVSQEFEELRGVFEKETEHCKQFLKPSRKI